MCFVSNVCIFLFQIVCRTAGKMYSSSVIHSILVASLVTASSSLIIKNLNSRESYSLVGREVCSGFAGNSDLYGLGIRLGIYLQWISSLLTNSLLPTTVSDLLDTNSIFLFAVFIAIAVATNLPGGLHPVEAFIMLQLCFGFLLSVLSVNGSKLILFNDAHGLDPERILFRLRRTPDTGHRMDRDMLYEFPFVRNRELIGTPTSGPPSGVTVPPLQGLFLRYIDTLAIYSISSGVISGRYGSIMIYSMELNLLVTDLIVFLCMSFDTAHETHDEPVEAYRQERLLDYKNKHKLPMEYQNAKLFSLGLTSPYKNDQVSWLGVFWRSCLVAGIGVYNVWFWIVGIKLLTTDSCPAYIFLLCKARILGPAGTLFKFMSVVYMIYAGGLIITACYSMLAFLGTTLRSLLINLFIMPYTKLLLIIASAGSDGARRTLESFGETRSQCLQWLDIPNVRQLLSAFVYLSSNPKEATIAENINPNEKPAMSYW